MKCSILLAMILALSTAACSHTVSSGRFLLPGPSFSVNSYSSGLMFISSDEEIITALIEPVQIENLPNNFEPKWELQITHKEQPYDHFGN